MKYLHNNKGVTMPIVLIALILGMMFGTTLLYIVNNQTKFNSVDKQIKMALEYAEAGYNKYLWHLSDDVNFYSIDPNSDAFKDSNKEEQDIAKRLLKGEVIKFQDGYYQVSVEKPSDSDRFVNIKSTGWTKENPEIKRTIEVKLRKKQFVHHVYVSDDDGSVWWSAGDKGLGPIHTNNNLNIWKNPIFYDTVSYAGQLNKYKDRYGRLDYNPIFKVINPIQPEKTNTLDFPDTNYELKSWAEKDNMVFYGRTCIYLNGTKIVIRNGNDKKGITVDLSRIRNKVIYVEHNGGDPSDKWDINSGNIFIAGELEGVLTIASRKSIYITHSDPTEWYDYENDKLTDESYTPNKIMPQSYMWSNGESYEYPEKGGIKYSKTTFQMSADEMARTAEGKDMLGLVAEEDICILHYGWPKKDDGYGNHWNFKWTWNDKKIRNVANLRRNIEYPHIWIDGVYYLKFKPPYNKNYDISIPGNRWVPSIKEYDVAPQNMTIHAALFAVTGGLKYLSYEIAPPQGQPHRENVTLWGSLSQKKRYALTSPLQNGKHTGYHKQYAHDPRMLYDYPPHILEPINVGWEIHEWKETNDHLIEKP